MKYFDYYWGPYTMLRCGKALLYRLDEQALEKATTKICSTIDKTVRYDVHTALVGLPDGGYNIIVANKRTNREVRGLIDPSFVAFSVAAYTAGTRWKSRNLLIWVEPYQLGWVIPTSGSRTAVKKGKQAHVFGVFGVIEIKTYRKWLEKTFQPLEPPKRLSDINIPHGEKP